MFTAMETNYNSSVRKPVYECYYSFGSADYDAIQESMKTHPFQPRCDTNVNSVNIEYNEYCNSIIDQFVPRTKHRQSLPIWYSSNTSNLLIHLQTQREQYKAKPKSYRKQKKLNVTNQSQQKLFFNRNTIFLFKHFHSRQAKVW